MSWNSLSFYSREYTLRGFEIPLLAKTETLCASIHFLPRRRNRTLSSSRGENGSPSVLLFLPATITAVKGAEPKRPQTFIYTSITSITSPAWTRGNTRTQNLLPCVIPVTLTFTHIRVFRFIVWRERSWLK